MAFEVEETGELTRTANITVPAEEYEKKVNAALRKLSSRVKVKGFRKGKIPLPVMRQRYGASVTQDVVQELVNEQVTAVLDGMGSILHLDTPTVTEIPEEGKGELKVTLKVELRPEIDPIGYLGLEVEQPIVEIADDEIDEELEQLQDQHSTLEPVVLREIIAEGDIVTVDFKALSEHEELKDMKGDDIQFKVGSGQVLPGIDSAVTGAAFDATVEGEVELGDDFPTEELRGEAVKLELKIKKVEREVLPALDDDFAQKTGDGETLLELRSNIRKRLTEAREKEARKMATANMMDRLLEQNEFSLPPLFLEEQVEDAAKRRLQMLAQQGINPEQFGITTDAIRDDIREEVDRQVRSELLLVEIARKEKVEVKEEDLTAYVEQISAEMGVPVQQYMAYARRNNDMLRQIQATVLLDKTRARLLNDATIKEVPWPTFDEEEVDEGAEEDSE